jgi:cyanophycinase
MKKQSETRPGRGSLLIIGGGEDRKHDKDILARFVELSGGADRKLVVLTAASTVPQEEWDIYDKAFGELSVARRSPLHVATREQANDPAVVRALDDADGIFMSGGDQKRLLGIVGGTLIETAMHAALDGRGACIAGTSAGASAMTAHMLADSDVELGPEKGAVSLGAGFAFLLHVVVDQHFVQRHRLARLLTAVAQNPRLKGIGIDEDTALLVQHGVGVEVLGAGNVTLLDGRHIVSNIDDIRKGLTPEMIDVRLHLLPSGSRYLLCKPEDKAGASHIADGQPVPVPAPLREFFDNIV